MKLSAIKRILKIREWPTEGGICHEVVDEVPAKWDDEEVFFTVVDSESFDRIAQELTELKSELENLKTKHGELLSYLPKVPTQSYEKQLAQELASMKEGRDAAFAMVERLATTVATYAAVEQIVANEGVELLDGPLKSMIAIKALAEYHAFKGVKK